MLTRRDTARPSWRRDRRAKRADVRAGVCFRRVLANGTVTVYPWQTSVDGLDEKLAQILSRVEWLGEKGRTGALAGLDVTGVAYLASLQTETTTANTAVQTVT